MAKKEKKRDKKYNPRGKAINQHQKVVQDLYLGATITPIKADNGQAAYGYYVAHLDLYRSDFDKFKHEFVYPNRSVLAGLNTLRHRWTLGYAVLCRDKKGKTYFVQFHNAVFKEPYTLDEVEPKIIELLMKAWNSANQEYRLALCYAISPVEFEFREWHLAASVYYRDVLPHLHTVWEKRNAMTFSYFDAISFNEFFYWFTHQKECGCNKTSLVNETISFEQGEKDEKIEAEMKALYPCFKFLPLKALPNNSRTLDTVRTMQQLEKAYKIYAKDP